MTPPTNVVTQEKRCTKCKVSLSISAFGRDKARYDGLNPACKTCANSRSASWKARNPDRVRRVAAVKHRSYCYGLTPATWDALVLRSEGRCECCNYQFYPDHARAICVDHCHDSNKVRGLLCQACNSMLGQAKDDAVRLGAGINYLMGGVYK